MLVLGIGRKQWKILQQQEERERAGGVHSASWGNLRAGRRADGGLKPGVKVTTGGDRPPRLGGDAVTFEDVREFLVAYSEYEQQMYITNQYGGDRVLSRRREMVDSATQVMVADEFYEGKPWVDLSEEELMQELNGMAALTCSRRVMSTFATRYSVC